MTLRARLPAPRGDRVRYLLQTGLTCMVLLIAVHARAHGEPDTEDRHASASSLPAEQTPWGIAGEPSSAVRSITVRMDDTMRFMPAQFAVAQGETVRLVIHNDGQLLHEFVLGTRDTLQEHAELMQRFPGMQHDEPYMAHVPPGGTAEIHWTFNRPGPVDFACLINGHYQAGMTGQIDIVAALVAD